MPVTLAGMGEVVPLTQVIELRARRRSERAAHAGMHPALRWVVAGSTDAHRRVGAAVTACGLSGALLLAEASTRLCRHCYTLRQECG